MTGPTSVACVRQAVEEFTAANPSIKVEIVTADHQNKPDVGINTVRSWFDQRGVDVVTDVGNSAIALGINPVCVERDKVHMNASAGTSELTGRACTPNSVHWSYDTWCLSNTSGTAITKGGGDSWYFITADYAFGHAIERDTTRFVEAAGGRMLGASRYPFPQTTDFSAFLLQAQASRAKVLGLAMAGDDLVNCVKQAQEFGLTRTMKLAAIIGSITGVLAAGLPTMQGMFIAETFWWDLNDRTRGFTRRVQTKLPAGVFPNYVHAAQLQRHPALPEGGEGARRGAGQGERAGDRGDDEAAADRRRRLWPRHAARGWAEDPSQLPAAGEEAGREPLSRRCLYPGGDGAGRAGLPAAQRGWLPAGEIAEEAAGAAMSPQLPVGLFARVAYSPWALA